jgi:ribosome-binding protein aMBF1 (putative translation factor)
MLRTRVVFYREPDAEVPVLDWLSALRKSNLKAYSTCVAAIERLAECGHELRRPIADLLRDGIHELRVRKGRVNYRIIPKATRIRRRRRTAMARTRDAMRILEGVTGDDSSARQNVANARVNLEVAQMIYDARTKAGLTQRGLAELIGSKQSVIARLEDADYDGHSLSMLQRIGDALGQRLEMRFVPAKRRGPRSASSASRSRRLLRRA